MANLAPVLDRYFAGSPLAGQGAAFVRAASRYGVDPRVLAVIATKESSLGRAQFAKNNPFGYNVHRSPTAPGPAFSSYEDAAGAVARTLSGPLYKGAGKRTLAQIIPTYAPPGENNTALYVSQVQGLARKLGMNPNANVFAQPGAAVPTAPAPARGGVPSPASPQAGAPSVAKVSAGLPFDFAKATAIIQANMRDALAGKMPPTARFQQLATLVQNAQAADPAAPVPRGGTAVVTTALGAVGQPAADQPPISGAVGGALKAAKSQLGVPYVFGGATPGKALDCSSLVQFAYSKAGVQIPRTTFEQYKALPAVKGGPKSWRPGDLLYSAGSDGTASNPGHVVMYLGNGKVIAAPHSGTVVQIQKLDPSKIVGVRRPG